MRWIANHHLDNEDLDLMFDWYQVAGESQVYGRIAVSQEGLISFWASGDPSPHGRPVNTMDKAISEILL